MSHTTMRHSAPNPVLRQQCPQAPRTLWTTSSYQQLDLLIKEKTYERDLRAMVPSVILLICVRLEAEFCFKFMLLVQQFCGDTQQKTFLALLFEHLRTTLWGDADCDRKVVPK